MAAGVEHRLAAADAGAIAALNGDAALAAGLEAAGVGALGVAAAAAFQPHPLDAAIGRPGFLQQSGHRFPHGLALPH
ncbi:MAG: hypothetical protein ACK559_17705, partial [bacterium]